MSRPMSSRRITVLAVALASAMVISLTPAFAIDPSGVWTRQFGTTALDLGEGVAGSGDDLYVVGTTDGEMPGAGGHIGDWDGFLRRYSTDGDIVWTRQFGTTGDDEARAVAVGPDGVYVAVALGSGAAVVAFDEDGGALWTKVVPASVGSPNMPRAVAVHPAGGVVVAGLVGHDGVLADGGGSSGGIDAFVARIDIDGDVVWVRQFGTTGTDFAGGVAVSSDGTIFVAGQVGGGFPDGGGSAGGVDAFVRSFDADGDVVWTRQFGGSGPDEAHGVAVHADGAIYVVGQMRDGEASPPDGFARRYDSNGDFVWHDRFGGAGVEVARDVAVDGSGGVFVAGEATGDGFIRLYHPLGSHLWTYAFGSASPDGANAITTTSSNRVVIAGNTSGTLPGGGGPFGSVDAFLHVVAVDPTNDTDGDGFPDLEDNFPLIYSKCRDSQATIIGTEGPDELHGTEGPDVIMGLGGDDTIYGHGGNDLICAGAGNDTVYGGDGRDKIYGENGHDTLYGEQGSDWLYGGNGNDNLQGGKGTRDKLFGGAGTNLLNGGLGTNDQCTLGPTFKNCEVIF